MLRAELASPITLLHNDLFLVANVSHWAATDLTYILGLNTLWIARSRTLTACHHRHNWLVICTGMVLIVCYWQRQSSHSDSVLLGEVSCRPSDYGPPNCCPMPGLHAAMAKCAWVFKMIICAPCLPPLLSHAAWCPMDDGRGGGAVNVASSHSEAKKKHIKLHLWCCCVNENCCGSSHNSNPLL